MRSASSRSPVSVTWNREVRCTPQDFQKFSRERVRSFGLSLAIMILFSGRKPVKIAGKGNEFSSNQLWDKTSGSDF